MITIDASDGIKELQATLVKLTPTVMQEVVAKSLNSSMTKARRAAYDEVSRVYNIRAIADVTSKLKGEPAKPGKLEARLYADSRGIQLGYFAPAQESSGKRRLSVEVKRGQRKTLKSAFWITANKGRGNELQSIFARGGYDGSREFQWRSKRIVQYPAPDLPIGLLRSTSPLDMLTEPAVKARIDKTVDEHLLKNLERRVMRILSKQGQGGE